MVVKVSYTAEERKSVSLEINLNTGKLKFTAARLREFGRTGTRTERKRKGVSISLKA